MGERIYRGTVVVTLLLSLVVVGLGAFTRLTEAGLGCPDWPGCYGFMTVPQTEAQQAVASEAFPHVPLEPQKAWNEMIHRYVAGTLGLLIAAIALLSFRRAERPKLLPSLLLGTVIFQALLGMWTVTMNLMPLVVMGHLLGGFATVTLLVLLALKLYFPTLPAAEAGSALRALAAAGLVAVTLQIALGGWTSSNYAAVVCTQLPVCEVDWVEKYDASAFHPISPKNDTYQFGVLNFDQRVTIHVTHRIGAIVVSALVMMLAVASAMKLGVRWGLGLGAVLALQIALGVTNVVAYLPLSVAVAHNLGGLLLLQCVVAVNWRLWLPASDWVTGRINYGES